MCVCVHHNHRTEKEREKNSGIHGKPILTASVSKNCVCVCVLLRIVVLDFFLLRLFLFFSFSFSGFFEYDDDRFRIREKKVLISLMETNRPTCTHQNNAKIRIFFAYLLVKNLQKKNIQRFFFSRFDCYIWWWLWWWWRHRPNAQQHIFLYGVKQVACVCVCVHSIQKDYLEPINLEFCSQTTTIN